MAGTYAVIGDPIEHSMSPNIHNAAFRKLGMDCSYIAYRIPGGELDEGVESLKSAGISGFNVTIPHKVGIMGHLDRTDERCSLIGAANTVSVSGGSLKGYNTDMDGFLDPLKRRGTGIAGMSVLLLGAGGAARAVAAGLASEGAASITIANRDKGRAAELARFVQRLGAESGSTGIGELAGQAGHDMIVNATSIGLGGEPTPVRDSQISPETVVYDIVYRPVKTDLVRKAKEKNAVIVYGYEMLLGQAARAFEIWHGTEAPYDAMKTALLGAGA